MTFRRIFKSLIGIPERPLGLRGNVSLTQEQFTALSEVAGFDLSAIRARILSEKTIISSQGDEAIAEFRRCMGIYVVGGIETSGLNKEIVEIH